MKTPREITGWILIWTWLGLSLSACGGSDRNSPETDYAKTAVNTTPTASLSTPPASTQPLANTSAVPPPQPPQAISLSETGLREVRLTWHVPSENYRYRIERAISAQGPFQALATVPASQGSYEDQGTVNATLEDGTAYYYRLTAIDPLGQESTSSPIQEGKTAAPPAPPSNVKVEILEGNTAVLRWFPVEAEGVVKYQVERLRPHDGSFQQIGETDKTEFKEERAISGEPVDATKNYYRIRTVNRVGAAGEASVAVQAITPSEPAPEQGGTATSAQPTPAARAYSGQVEVGEKPVSRSGGATSAIPTAPQAKGEDANPVASPVEGEIASPAAPKAGEPTANPVASQPEPVTAPPGATQEPEKLGSKREQTEQANGTKVKKSVTTTTSTNENGGTTTITTTETTTFDRYGFLKKDKEVVTLTITPDPNGGETTVTTTETTTINKDGSSRTMTQTYESYKRMKPSAGDNSGMKDFPAAQ